VLHVCSVEVLLWSPEGQLQLDENSIVGKVDCLELKLL
jgi:hypothetical protein